MTDSSKTGRIINALEKLYPNARCALTHNNPLQLLVATILSAQCTDARVNMVTPFLFKKYKTAADYAKAGVSALEREIHSTGFYRNKAKNIIAMAKEIDKKFGGEVPSKMELLTSLPGVGRKTANVILGTAFNIAEGVVVDTHVMRLSRLIGLSKNTAPEKIELDLMALVPKNKWIAFSHLLTHHGRNICIARRPKCPECPIVKYCDYGRNARLKTAAASFLN